jgi:multidrug efflux pump
LKLPKPELLINLDRERANREGITAAAVGDAIRTGQLGKEVAKYREGEDQYPIMLRFEEISVMISNNCLILQSHIPT